MSESDRDYYRRRIAQEVSAAEQASCAQIQGVHERLAELYTERLDLLLTNPARLVYSSPLPVDRSATADTAASSAARTVG